MEVLEFMEYAFVKVSSRNQVVLPVDVMRDAEIEEGEKLLAKSTKNGIELVKITGDPLIEIRKANAGKETEIKEAVKEALAWKKR